jgi:hypothetical protein
MPGLRSLVRAFLFTWPLLFAPVLGCSSGDPPAAVPDADPGDGMPPCSLGPTMADIEVKLFQGMKCKTCHVLTASGMHPLYPTNLDLGSPGLAERMVDKATEADPAKGKCAGRVLVPKNDPLGGIFVEKVERPSCGDRMPQALPALNPDEVSCVKRWAILAAKSVP